MVIYGFPQWWLWLMMVINPSEKLMIMVNWLVVSTYPSEKWWSESQLGWWNSQYMENQKQLQTTNQIINNPEFWLWLIYIEYHPLMVNLMGLFSIVPTTL